ncbi:MAG: DUF547 domain-containing protein [Ignavibacteriaceae bacterium]
MVKLFLLLFIFFSINAFSQINNKSYSEILNKFVKDGLVNYEEIKNDKNFQEYLNQLSDTNVDELSSNDAKLAYWINVYNAFTIKVIIDNYPVESITDLNWGGMAIAQVLGKTIWHKEFIKINSKTFSLNDIEHEIIRKKFNEPRIHFALVCAAISCPELRNEAYSQSKLEEQLNDQAKNFLNNKSKNQFNLQNKTAHISKIFDWYGDDFGKDDKSILLYFTKFIYDDSIVKSIKGNPGEWKIEFMDYNWCLNKKKTKMTDDRCVFDLDTIKGWFLSLGKNYNVNPWIFGGIYVGAIPFFTLCVGWIISNYRKNKSIVLPSLLTGFFFISAYLYLIIVGENVPWWVYGIVVLMIAYGTYSTIKKIRKRYN